VTLPSYATDIWGYFTTFMAWDVITLMIGLVGLGVAAMVVRLVWGIINRG
jgi:hypothetical protein